MLPTLCYRAYGRSCMCRVLPRYCVVWPSRRDHRNASISKCKCIHYNYEPTLSPCSEIVSKISVKCAHSASIFRFAVHALCRRSCLNAIFITVCVRSRQVYRQALMKWVRLHQITMGHGIEEWMKKKKLFLKKINYDCLYFIITPVAWNTINK